ncbi:MAG: restriction endonuclease subunit S [Candidatus Dormibacteraeota bacterium]|nr:restriction endonuclease subunit S [Candidatus Dormibacteraeota bacterium]
MARVSTADLIESGVLEIGDGYRAKNSELAPTGIPFARAQNLNNGFDFTGADRYPVEALGRVGSKVSQPGDCVLTSKGSVGRVGYVGRDTPRFVYSPQLSYWRSLAPAVIEPLYLRYWLLGPEFGLQRDAVKGSTDMADYVNLRDQRRMSITLPPIQSQRKIAAILSAYDDLIENNDRRIKLLEEMAQRIYREWFVDFRYPGHENVPLVDSEQGRIPQGWAVSTLGNVCARITDGAHNSPATTKTGMPMASVKDMTPRSLELSTCRLIAEEDYDALVRQDCRPWSGDVLVSKDGANFLKHVFPMFEDSVAVILSSIAVLRPSDAISPILLALTIREPENKARLKGFVSGAAIPRVVLRDFKLHRLVVPLRDTQERFNQTCVDVMRQAVALESLNRRLRATRDLLLPRLISGEIEVSDLAIAIPAAAA